MSHRSHDGRRRHHRRAQGQYHPEIDRQLIGAVQPGALRQGIRQPLDEGSHQHHEVRAEQGRQPVHREGVQQTQIGVQQERGDQTTAEVHGDDEHQAHEALAHEMLDGGDIAQKPCAHDGQGGAHHGTQHGDHRTLGYVGPGKDIGIVLYGKGPGPEGQAALHRVRSFVEGDHELVPEGVDHDEREHQHETHIEHIEYLGS